MVHVYVFMTTFLIKISSDGKHFDESSWTQGQLPKMHPIKCDLRQLANHTHRIKLHVS